MTTPIRAAALAALLLSLPSAAALAADAPKAPAGEGKTAVAPRATEAELKWYRFDEGAALAARSKKALLVDVYTSWCGWCKRMEATTYKDPRVIAELNEHFVLVKLNAESDRPLTYKGEKTNEMRLSREVFGVTGYPTTVFLRADGEVITPVSGYLAADKFRTVLTFIGTGAYENTKWSDYQKKNS